MKWQVWMQAEHDMCDSSYGGVMFGESDADTWEEACIEVMKPRNDSYWDCKKPTDYWGAPLCKSEKEAYRYFSKEHPHHPEYRNG